MKVREPMKTEDLIARLVNDPMPLPLAPPQRLAHTLLGAGALCVLLLWLVLGINPELSALMVQPAFVAKMAWLLGLMAVCGYGLLRLARPGMPRGRSVEAIALVFVSMLVLGLAQLWRTVPSARMGQWLGVSWGMCLLSIVLLGLPVLAALLWALRQLAPTHAVLTGAVAGGLAGSVAAAVYSLHCTETSYVFYAAWYGGGVALVGVLGAVAGKRWLRW